MKRAAIFSKDRVFRYYLKIVWDDAKPLINFCMLNPSTADEVQNDPTVERCCRRAQMWGYGGLIVTNLFALRSTDPKQLYFKLTATRRTVDIVGCDNDYYIFKATTESAMTICGWGQHGRLSGRDKAVLQVLEGAELYYLKMGANGQPYHPLYLSYDLKPIRLV